MQNWPYQKPIIAGQAFECICCIAYVVTLLDYIWSELSCAAVNTQAVSFSIKFVKERPRVQVLGQEMFLSHAIVFMAHDLMPYKQLHLSHLCQNPCCIDPRHLYVEHESENVARSNTPDRWFLVFYSGMGVVTTSLTYI